MSAAEEADRTLARLLHGRGFLGEEPLRACLEEARARRARGDGAASLAAILLSRGLVTEQLLARARAASQRLLSVSGERAPPPPPPPPAATGEPSLADSVRASAERLQASWEHLGASGEARKATGLPGRLGPWSLVRELARGGMGAVWEVEHTGTGERQALKLMLDRGPLSPLDPEEVARFRREAETLGKLAHPGVVRLLDADLAARTPWFVQELLPGGSLEQRLREGPLPVAEVIALGIALGEALSHAHTQGVLHRDLKPANVLFDADGAPRLVDFGLARAAEDHERLTRTGALLGTPHYMAPEQAIGLKEDDPRTDVYGLGAVLYVALTGRPPFEGVGSMTVLQAVINDPPPPPRQHRPETPLALEALLLRTLAKERDQRPASVAELTEALRALEGLDEAAPAGGSRIGLVAGLAALAALSLLAALGLVLLRARTRQPALDPGPPVASLPPPPAELAPPAEPASPAASRRPARVWPAPIASGAPARRWHLTWIDRDLGETTPSRIELELTEVAAEPTGELQDVSLRIDRLRCAIAMGQMVRTYDSHEEGGGFVLLVRALKPLVGATLRARVDPRTGEVQDLGQEDFPRPDLSEVRGGSFLEGLAATLEHAVAARSLQRLLASATHLLPAPASDVGDDAWEFPLRVWVEHEWGIVARRGLRRERDGVWAVDHRGGPWRMEAAPDLGWSISERARLDEVTTTRGEAQFDARGLVRVAMVLDYQGTTGQGERMDSTCTLSLERIDP